LLYTHFQLHVVNVISDTGILQGLAGVMIEDCRYDVSDMLSCQLNYVGL